jgi:hypothetical protein
MGKQIPLNEKNDIPYGDNQAEGLVKYWFDQSADGLIIYNKKNDRLLK